MEFDKIKKTCWGCAQSSLTWCPKPRTLNPNPRSPRDSVSALWAGNCDWIQGTYCRIVYIKTRRFDIVFYYVSLNFLGNGKDSHILWRAFSIHESACWRIFRIRVFWLKKWGFTKPWLKNETSGWRRWIIWLEKNESSFWRRWVIKLRTNHLDK